jgi:hypothetical protein
VILRQRFGVAAPSLPFVFAMWMLRRDHVVAEGR